MYLSTASGLGVHILSSPNVLKFLHNAFPAHLAFTIRVLPVLVLCALPGLSLSRRSRTQTSMIPSITPRALVATQETLSARLALVLTAQTMVSTFDY